MRKKFIKEQIDAANESITAKLYVIGTNQNAFSKDERKELEKMDDSSNVKRDKVLEILNKQILNLDASLPDMERSLDASIANIGNDWDMK